MIHTNICCKSLATQELFDGTKEMKTNGTKLPIRLVTVYGTTKKLHTNLPIVQISDPVISSPSKCMLWMSNEMQQYSVYIYLLQDQES